LGPVWLGRAWLGAVSLASSQPEWSVRVWLGTVSVAWLERKLPEPESVALSVVVSSATAVAALCRHRSG
jgi:hypothetical protein